MSTEPPEQTPGGAETPPTEEEMRAALEEQMRNIRVEDLLLQSVASLVNLTARRIAKPDERDLGQAQIGIESVAALVGFLPEEAAKQVLNALSELRVLYAQAAGGGGEEPPEGGSEGPPGGGEGPSGGGPGAPPAPGPRQEPPPRLWTPGS